MLALILDYTHVNVVLFLFIFQRIRVCTKKKGYRRQCKVLPSDKKGKHIKSC